MSEKIFKQMALFGFKGRVGNKIFQWSARAGRAVYYTQVKNQGSPSAGELKSRSAFSQAVAEYKSLPVETIEELKAEGRIKKLPSVNVWCKRRIPEIIAGG